MIERISLTSLLLFSSLVGLRFTRIQDQVQRIRFTRAGLHPHTATLPNGHVRYWAGGRTGKRPLLLIHGFGGDAAYGWSAQLPLANDRFIVAPDLLWFGDSYTDHDDFTPAFQAETFLQLLDHLALDRVDVVGISYGGFVAMELGERYPERVRRVVLVDSPGPVYTLADYHAMLDRLGFESIAELVVPSAPTGVKRLIQLAFHWPPPVPGIIADDVFDALFKKWSRQKIRLLDELIAMADTVDPADYDWTHPTLILWGEHDELFPTAIAERLAAALKGPTRIELLPRTNHAPNMERPALFNQLVRRFLDEDLPQDGATASKPPNTPADALP